MFVWILLFVMFVWILLFVMFVLSGYSVIISFIIYGVCLHSICDVILRGYHMGGSVI